MNRQQYFTDIVTKFNEDENHPSLSPIEHMALKKIKAVEQVIIETSNKIDVLVKEINERNQEIINLQNQIAKERGKSEGIQEMLISTME